MKLKEFKKLFVIELSEIYPITETDTFFFLLVEEYLGFQRVDIVLKPDFEIPIDKKELLDTALQRLKNEEPIQYILGKTAFYGLPFLVDKNTLIPRPETEELVEWIVLETQKLRKSQNKTLDILDIGTGTGCIPISLKKHLPNTTISAIDISKKALKIAKENAQLNGMNIHFYEADILQIRDLNLTRNISTRLNTVSMRQSHTLKETNKHIACLRNNVKFDSIVSNPPYVRALEKTTLKKNVLHNEPHLALFVEDENPLIFYKKIADLTKNHLTKNGLLFFEINQYLGKEILEMLHKKRFKNIELRKDLFGNDRMVKCGLI